jgi:hypothetical protein
MNKTDARNLARDFSETYFSMARSELKAFSKDHLYLGCRFNAAGSETVRAAGKYSDVISANQYLYRALPLQYGATSKPIMISEFHFAKTDGRSLGGGLRSAIDAQQQARLLKAYMMEAVEHPQILGAHWFQYRDQCVGGRYDGENYSIGLVDITDQLNRTLMESMSEISKATKKYFRD